MSQRRELALETYLFPADVSKVKSKYLEEGISYEKALCNKVLELAVHNNSDPSFGAILMVIRSLNERTP